MNKAKWLLGTCLAMALALLGWGCAGTAKTADRYDAVTGKHPAGWMQNHWADYVKSPDQCRNCHGSTTDPNQAGGISKVSCFTCHASGVNHPAHFSEGVQHGRVAAMQPPSQDPKAMVGFAHCTKCHGSSYDNGLVTSCKACHTRAPHPNRPWNGSTASRVNHAATSVGNAPECFKCHAGGANSTLTPATTPPAGTAPGCFNDTLCHARP